MPTRTFDPTMTDPSQSVVGAVATYEESGTFERRAHPRSGTASASASR